MTPMASARRQAVYKENSRAASQRGMYVYGNVVPKPAYEFPERQKQTTRVSRQVRQNRRNAQKLNGVYVLFLVAASVMMVLVCVHFLQLKALTRQHAETITAYQEELATLVEKNDTAYNAACDSVNLDTIRERAVQELGMVYPAAGQVISYESPASDYVRQYEAIPESGVLAQSAEVE